MSQMTVVEHVASGEILWKRATNATRYAIHLIKTCYYFFCPQVSYCSYRCKDKASEKHKPVCEAFTVIQNYRKNFIRARTQEVD